MARQIISLYSFLYCCKNELGCQKPCYRRTPQAYPMETYSLFPAAGCNFFFFLATLSAVAKGIALSVLCLCCHIKVGSLCRDISASVQNLRKGASLSERFGTEKKQTDSRALRWSISRGSLSRFPCWLTIGHGLEQNRLSVFFSLMPPLHREYEYVYIVGIVIRSVSALMNVLVLSL